MAVCDPPPVQQTVLEKIESFVTDPAYIEMLESSASYNSRLSSERRIRMPFVDTHTGVAQTHSDLFKSSRQRMPGLVLGQVYTYPSKRWCKRRRQYLMGPANGRRPDRDDDNSNTGDNPLVNEDSKDSSGLKDEVSKDQWYYEDEMMEMDAYDDPDMDSDYDYDDHYRSGRKKKRTGKAPARSRGSSRANATNSPKGGNNRRSRGNPSAAVPGGHPGRPVPPPQAVPPLSHVKDVKDDKPTSPAPNKLPDTPEMDPYKHLALSDDKARVAASPYCDFCLGDSAENRKTATPEELVSCSDCGRSGHPSCLQFTPNMIRSVRKYRWQCIECKCCSICGTSDNDDQLLFCDDCDRGYHMYCLAPPLTTPPEGSWSCGLCLVEFHRRGK